MFRFIFLLGFLALAGCVGVAWKEDLDRLTSNVSALHIRHQGAPVGPATDPELDAMLSGTLDVATLVHVAVSRHPELREALARTQAALAAIRGASALEDPMLSVTADRVPVRQPVAFRRDDMNILGLEQAIPFPGKLDLRGEAALREAEVLHQRYRERERDLIARVKKTYFEYFTLTKELEVHLEHIKILEEFERISTSKYRTGTVSQQDVLKPQVELVMLHNDVVFVEQKLISAKAALNVLLNRPDGAPLGRPKDVVPVREAFDLDQLQNLALEGRPQVRAAELKSRASEAALRVAQRDAAYPDFSVGLMYMQMSGRDDAWGGSVGINLPWLTGKRSAEADRLAHQARADRIALEGIHGQVRFEVRDAFQRVEAARKSVTLYEGELLPKSRQSVEVSRSSYEKDKTSFLDLLDAERSQRDIKIRHYEALAQYESAVADLERAVGTDVRRRP
ncbi:MAG: TolC family protein [Planctomycetes bacterium]|nr:TolC family protein [Planctomycetota bacterium]